MIVSKIKGINSVKHEVYKVGRFIKRKRIRLTKDANLSIELKGEGVVKYCIKEGFTSDGGSIPYGFGWVISRWNPKLLLICYLIHDANFASKTMTFDEQQPI